MCGRFTLVTPAAVLDALGLAGAFGDWQASYNVAPGTELPCVVNRAERRARRLRWGLVPHWAEDPRIGFKMINARRETVASKPAFRDALARRRCLVIADGFYEWKAEGRRKSPSYFHRTDGAAFAFAGLWASWGRGDDRLETVTIVTAPANAMVAEVHDRMPVIVDPADYARWLHEDPVEPTAVEDVLLHPDYRDFEMFAVSSRVNSVKNDGPELVARAPTQPQLF